MKKSIYQGIILFFTGGFFFLGLAVYFYPTEDSVIKAINNISPLWLNVSYSYDGYDGDNHSIKLFIKNLSEEPAKINGTVQLRDKGSSFGTCKLLDGLIAEAKSTSTIKVKCYIAPGIEISRLHRLTGNKLLLASYSGLQTIPIKLR